MHDYNSICEHPNLLENGSRFCGYTAKPCDDCIDCQYVHGIKMYPAKKQEKLLGSFKNPIYCCSIENSYEFMAYDIRGFGSRKSLF